MSPVDWRHWRRSLHSHDRSFAHHQKDEPHSRRLLANGLTPQQVLEELPDLEAEDIQACLKFASTRVNYPMGTS